MRRGFTLIEILIVIGIVAALATVVVLALNPAEILRQGRDAKRLSELNSLNSALAFVLSQRANPSLGFPDVAYVSLPDTASDCSTHTNLPALPPGWTYQCATEQDYRKVDGNGWLPVDFTGLASTVFDVLPVDPVNTDAGGLYYSYFAGSWELNAVMESAKYGSGGNRDVVGKDGGTDDNVFEIGTELSLSPLDSVTVRVAESCSDGADSVASFQEVYSKWTIPGSGQGKLKKLWLWQSNANQIEDGETVELALYEEQPLGSGTYNKLAGASVVLSGSDSTGWVSVDISTPVLITLGRTYVFGVGPTSGSPVGYYVLNRDTTPLCSEYLPNALSKQVSAVPWSGLDNSVTFISGLLGYHSGIFGVTYTPW